MCKSVVDLLTNGELYYFHVNRILKCFYAWNGSQKYCYFSRLAWKGMKRIFGFLETHNSLSYNHKSQSNYTSVTLQQYRLTQAITRSSIELINWRRRSWKGTANCCSFIDRCIDGWHTVCSLTHNYSIFILKWNADWRREILKKYTLDCTYNRRLQTTVIIS